MSYQITIETERDWETLHWLADRGYDGGVLNAGTYSDKCAEFEGMLCAPYVLDIDEPSAWEVCDAVEEDPDAFLACCGSDTLERVLIDFVGSIV